MAWKMLHEFEEYEISVQGQIRRKRTGRLLKNSVGMDGYEKIGFRKTGDRKKYWFRVHRLVAYAFCNPPENWNELQVDHIDRNILNNDYNNLRWVSSEENNANRKDTHWKTNTTTKELYVSKCNHGFLVRFRKKSFHHTSYHTTLESAILTRDSLLTHAVEKV